MKIGMIVATFNEIQQILNEYGSSLVEIKKNCYTVHKTTIKEHELYIAHSGAGEIGAAATAQMLITAFDVELIVNYGIVGALDPNFALTECVVVKDVVHYDYDTSVLDCCKKGEYTEFTDGVHILTTQKYVDLALKVAPQLRAVSCASGDKFVEGAENKAKLRDEWNCQICEMEAAAITLTCRRNGIDCLLIKAVSDSATGGAEEFLAMEHRSAKVCMDVLLSIIATL